MLGRLKYWQRIFAAYLAKNKPSQLSFWHGKPLVNYQASYQQVGQYYMPFLYKANYAGPFDQNGIPLLDYRGHIGKQYNPIAIAQYGLGHFNLYKQTGNKKNLEIATKQAVWLVNNLEKNKQGVSVWMHHFDWEYRDLLKNPWYSALAQGNGISLLLRIYKETNNNVYLETAKEAFKSLGIEIKNGGVLYIDQSKNYWLEETIVNPPTHILNGFFWTLWGVWDYYLTLKDQSTLDFFNLCIKTLKENLKSFDIGWWSLYEQSNTKMKMLTSRFYHSLHVVQLEIMYFITKDEFFKKYHNRWDRYQKNKLFIFLSQVYKSIFKIFYY